jgi:putative tryptophan/tyrosine transport system substrate-binding protein
MRRREFVKLLGGAVAAWPAAVPAQRPKMPIIGYLSSFSEKQSGPAIAAVRRGLSEGGLVDGQDVAIEFRFSDGQYDRLPGLGAELIRQRVDLIFGAGPPAAIAAKAQTNTIPIVFVVGDDPVAGGLVTNLSRPGGNVTGLTHMSSTLVEKRLGILLQLIPGAAVIAMLANPASPEVVPEIKEMQAATQQRGLRLEIFNAAAPTELDAAFTALAEKRPDALVIASDPFYLTRASEITASAARLALPTMYPYREFSGPGGLISYGTNRLNTYRLAGGYASRIIKGTRPGDLPVIQPTVFDLVINLKTAKVLGLGIPDQLLALADQVIE